MSEKNPLAPLTEDLGLIKCSMGRCCNARKIEKLLACVEQIKMYGRVGHSKPQDYYEVANDCLEEIK